MDGYRKIMVERKVKDHIDSRESNSSSASNGFNGRKMDIDRA